MRWLLLVFVVGCAMDDECEPFIEYSMPDGPPNMGCHNLEFYEISIPDAWYPIDTRARVDECKRRGYERLFECEPDGSWRELFLYNPPPR